MTEADYRALRQQVTILSQEIQTLKDEISRLKGETPAHKCSREEAESFKKSREEFFTSYRKFLQAIRKGMDADLVIKYKRQYLKEIERRFTGEYIDRTKSRFLAEFEFAYNSAPKIIVVDGYSIPVGGDTLGGESLIDVLEEQKEAITDDEIRSVAKHYYERLHHDNIPAMMAMLDRALDMTPLNTLLDEQMPWDDTSMETR